MINKVILMGRLTADPEMRQTPSGVSVCRFTVAVNRPYADKQTKERQSDFINVTAWRNTADFVTRYFSKGKMIIVEGSLRNNNYTDQNGVKHYSMEVMADNVAFGESKSAASGNAGGQCNSAPSAQQPQQPQSQVTYNVTQQPLENFNTNYTLMNEYEVLSDGDVPF